MELFRFILCAILLISGIIVFFIGIFGIYKFKFVMNRMHAAALLDTMGLLLVIISLVVAKGFSAISIKMLLVIVFLWITSPIASHLIAKMEYLTDNNLEDEVTNNLEEVKKGDKEDGNI